MNKKIGFIGCGNMAEAIISGILRANLVLPEQIIASNPTETKLKRMEERYAIQTTTDNTLPARDCNILFLSVKPIYYAAVIEEIRSFISFDCVVVMIAAGQTLARNSQRFGKPVKLVRAMPNTPALAGEGMTAISINPSVTEEEKSEIFAIFSSFGKAEFVDEALMDAVTGVSGSSPAYAYLFIEALADGAVVQGMPRKQAYTFAAQAVLGAAKMVLQTGEHPGVLKDNVCSPGGTTIAAVASLEEDGFRAAVMHAVKVCAEKSKNMTE